MANALASESSPYLRQHAENPVDWLAWGPQALERARAEDKPLLVSIGYSSCHWCHVMERESFEDPQTAELMNESFVCVKVDREERPDVDAIYMEAVQGMTGRGGWPLNVFLTPEQLPFYGGTYFPPEPRQGMPSWTQVLQAISESWDQNREEIRAGGERLRSRLSGAANLSPSAQPIADGALEAAVARLRESFDPRNGGFGGGVGGPRFPQASVIEFLLLRDEREMTLATLRAMAGGGIHDQIGGGFSRYSVDEAWAVPHFEKMLYDNALLARAYLHGWQVFQDEDLREVCVDTLEWALREMRGPEGGFYAALDADSEGVEGRFYVWTVAELKEVLGEDADAAIAWLGATGEGNFVDPHHPQPGLNVLQDRGFTDGGRPEESFRARVASRLLAARSERVRPGLDDKRLTSWNALMISALAEAGAALAEPRFLEAAVACADFVLRDLRDGSGHLLRTYNEGQAKLDAYLEDHAFLLEALIALFEATCEARWFEEATALADEMVARFADPEQGGFFSTSSDGEALIARRKDVEDAPIPSGSSSAAVGLLRLAQITGEEAYERHAVSVLRLLHELAPRHPTAFGHLLQAMHWYLSPARPLACPVPGRA
ncbi:MAG: thioredoxin protein [Solirubrobacterales bacterium]|nr:thioredoxin protein [Solirubrobacterales bacterium]